MSMRRSTGERPEPDRLIRLYCEGTFGAYFVVGKMVRYKPGSPKNRVGQSRFMRETHGSWNADLDAWKSAEAWEYVETK